MKGKKKRTSVFTDAQNLHNAFHVQVAIELRKGTQTKALKIANGRERGE